MKKLLKSEYAIGVIANVLSLFVGIGYSAVLARYLGAELKGETAYISSVAGILGMFLCFGLHQVYPYYRKSDADIRYKFMNNIYFIFAVYVAILAVVCIVYNHSVVFVSAIAFAVIAAYMKIVGYIYSVENSVKKNILMLIVHIVQLVYVICLMIFTEASLFWGITNLIFVDLVLSVIYTVKLKVKVNFKMIDFKFVGKLFATGFVPMITILAEKFSYKVDILMLEAYPNVSMAQLGVYSIGVMLAEKVLLVPGAVKDILVSRLAKGRTADEVARIMRMCFPVCLMMFVAIMVLGDFFIELVYGAQYDGAYGVTVVTMFGVCAVMFHRMIELYNIVNHKQKFTLMIAITSTIVNVLINMFTIPRWGIMGAAVATVISYTYSTVVCLFYFKWHTGIKIRNMIFITKGDIVMIKGMLSKKKVKSNTGNNTQEAAVDGKDEEMMVTQGVDDSESNAEEH